MVQSSGKAFQGWLAVAAAMLVIAWAANAEAYSYESLFSVSCHEDITSSALRALRQELETAAALRSNDDDRALIDDLPFQIDDDMDDIGAVALLLGVRDNDTKGLHGLDSFDLTSVHGNPDTQVEHCLRRPEHDGTTGTEAALKGCNDYIVSMVTHAIDQGLTDGRPDANKRTIMPVHLSIAGRVDARLPIFYVYMGHALHALQDSFTHNFRTSPDALAVTVVLNWVEDAEDLLDERRDGPPHMVGLDQCNDDAYLRHRKGKASEASIALLRAALNPLNPDRDGKLGEVNDALTQFLSLAPNYQDCKYETRWCDAAENAYRDPTGCGCRVARRADAPMLSLVAWFLAALALMRRIRLRRLAGPAMVAAAILALPGAARAQPAPVTADPQGATTSTSSEPPEESRPIGASGSGSALACTPGRQLACACPGGSEGYQSCTRDGTGFSECRGCAAPRATVDAPSSDRGAAERAPSGPVEAHSPFGLYAASGMAIDNAAAAFSVGARYRFDEKWIGGADAEWNPWISVDTKRLRPGTLNTYLTLIRRYPINDSVSLRTSVHAGLSFLLFNLYGARSGSFGPYLGLNLLGVEFRLAKRWRLVIDPADVAYATPKISGTPLLYRQYRFTIGIQLGA